MSNTPVFADNMETCLRGCEEAVLQCIFAIESLTPAQFAERPGGHSSIGAHLRHCIEHFTCFQQGWQTGEVNYDARQRDLDLESNPAAARAAFEQILAGLRDVQFSQPSTAIAVRQMAAHGAEPQCYASSLARELVFLSSHTIHHLALVQVMARAAGCALPENVGLAHSTAAYRRQTGG